jgi:hypothetical protein
MQNSWISRYCYGQHSKGGLPGIISPYNFRLLDSGLGSTCASLQTSFIFFLALPLFSRALYCFFFRISFRARDTRIYKDVTKAAAIVLHAYICIGIEVVVGCSGVGRRQLCKNIEKLFVAQEIVSLRRRKGHTEVLPNENKCFGIYVAGAIYININVCVSQHTSNSQYNWCYKHCFHSPLG